MSETKTVLADLLTVISEKLGEESGLRLLMEADGYTRGRFEVAGAGYEFCLLVREAPHD